MSEKDKLPVIIIITSVGCHPCHSMRGPTGKPLPSNPSNPKTIFGGSDKLSDNLSWDIDFFKALLKGNHPTSIKNDPTQTQKFRLYELFGNFYNVGFDFQNIVTFSEYSLKDDKLIRDIISHDGETIIHEKETNNVTTHKKKHAPPDSTHHGFTEFISGKVPKSLKNFIFSFPSWFFFNADLFNEAITNPVKLYPFMIGFDTAVDINGKYYIDIGENGSKQKPKGELYNPLIVANYILLGNISLLPPITSPTFIPKGIVNIPVESVTIDSKEEFKKGCNGRSTEIINPSAVADSIRHTEYYNDWN